MFWDWKGLGRKKGNNSNLVGNKNRFSTVFPFGKSSLHSQYIGTSFRVINGDTRQFLQEKGAKSDEWKLSSFEVYTSFADSVIEAPLTY